MACEELLGDDFNIFWDTEDDFADPTWVRQLSLGDIGFNPNRAQVEIPKRIRTKTYKNGRGDWEVTFTMNYSRSNSFHRAIMLAITSDGQNPLHLAICDGDDIDDPEASYAHAWWEVAGPLSASLDEGATVEITCKPSCFLGDDDDELPEFVQGST